MLKSTCAARGCRVEVAHYRVFCPDHWALVPWALRFAYEAADRNRRATCGLTSTAWRRAVEAAVAAVDRAAALAGPRRLPRPIALPAARGGAR